MRRLSLLLATSLLAACGQGPAVFAPSVRMPGAQTQSVPGEVIVKLTRGASAEAFARRHGLQVVSRLGLDMVLFKGATGPQALDADPEARWVEANVRFSLPALKSAPAPKAMPRTRTEGPNDPLLPAQYGVRITGADQVWPVQSGRSEVVVAVIDSGIDATHPEFEGQLLPGWDVTVTPHQAGGHEDGYGHGTHVAGVIGAMANNGQGIAGVAPGCKLLPVRIFNKFGHSTTGAAAAAVIWAVDHGARVINASWGSPMPGQAAEDAYQYALAQDVVFVSAVGNSGNSDTKSYPGATPGVIGVAATTDIDTWGSFSTFGDWVSVAAPGKGILSTYPMAKGNGYRIMDGTSMASPLVAAAAALIRSQHPQLTQAQVKTRLEATAKDVIQSGKDPYAGHGRIDIRRAVLDPLGF